MSPLRSNKKAPRHWISGEWAYFGAFRRAVSTIFLTGPLEIEAPYVVLLSVLLAGVPIRTLNGKSRSIKFSNVTLYGRRETKWVKMVKATYQPAGHPVLILIVREAANTWRAFMCTHLSGTAEEVLEVVADRSAVEQNFHDLKEIEGAGQQQVRNIKIDVGVFHLNMWVHTMIELWAWGKKARVICDHRDAPWDQITRRPSHTDRRVGVRREALRRMFFETNSYNYKDRKVARQFDTLMKLPA